MDFINKICHGDGLQAIKLLPDNSVDLCYIDPQFFTCKDHKSNPKELVAFQDSSKYWIDIGLKLYEKEEKDVILDTFCGSGTTISVAKRLKRNFIGIDISKDAVEISANRIGYSLKDIIEIPISK